MKTTGNARVQKYRAHLREKGLRPIQIWVPDTHKQGFAEECKRQALLAIKSIQEQEILDFIEHSSDLRGWK